MEKEQVLIVDDDQGLLKLLTMRLAAMGFAVTACPDANSALEEARLRRFDLVITDLRLAEGDGLAVMEEVRALLGNLGIHVDSWIRCEPLERVLTVNDFKAWCAKNNRPLKSESDWTEYFARKGHPQGWAIDFTCSGYGSPLEIVQTIAASSIKFDQCIQEGNLVHVSFDPRMRRQVLTATFVKGAATYSKGISV